MDGDDTVTITLVPDQAGRYPHPTWKDVEEYIDIPETRKQACQYYSNKDYEKAADLFRKLAEMNDTYSEVRYGLLLLYGEGIKQDTSEGLEWIRKAYDQKNIYARTVLGFLHCSDKYVKQNYGEAVRLYQKGVSKGYGLAEYDLGLLYLNGHGVEQDFHKAYSLFEKAEKHGAGTVAIKNAKEIAQLGIEAEQGNAEKQYELSDKFKYRNGEEWVKWLKKSAERGYTKAQAQLMGVYRYGNNNVEINYTESLRLCDQLADSTDEEIREAVDNTYSIIGRDFEDDIYQADVEKDMDLALECYQKGTDHNMPKCMFFKARTFYDSDDPEYISNCIKLFERCAEMNPYVRSSANSADSLAEIYFEGKKGIQKDLTKAIYWYKKYDEMITDHHDYFVLGDGRKLETYGTTHPKELAYCYLHAPGSARNYSEGVALCFKLSEADEGEYLINLPVPVEKYDEEHTKKYEQYVRDRKYSFGDIYKAGLLYSRLNQEGKATKCYLEAYNYAGFKNEDSRYKADVMFHIARAYATGAIPGYDYQDAIDMCVKGIDALFKN